MTDLKHYENEIEFNYSAVSINHTEDLIFNYRLVGSSQEWKKTKNRKIQYAGLDPGDYKFEIYSELSTDKRKGDKAIKTVDFSIYPIWYKNS